MSGYLAESISAGDIDPKELNPDPAPDPRELVSIQHFRILLLPVSTVFLRYTAIQNNCY